MVKNLPVEIINGKFSWEASVIYILISNHLCQMDFYLSIFLHPHVHSKNIEFCCQRTCRVNASETSYVHPHDMEVGTSSEHQEGREGKGEVEAGCPSAI